MRSGMCGCLRDHPQKEDTNPKPASIRDSPTSARKTSVCIRLFVRPVFTPPKPPSDLRCFVKAYSLSVTKVLCVKSIRVPAASDVHDVHTSKIRNSLLHHISPHPIFP